MTSIDELRKYAVEIAKNHQVTKKHGIFIKKFPEIEADNKFLVSAYKATNRIVRGKEEIVPAAEWLLDNFYMIQEHVKILQQGLGKQYKKLPLLNSGKYKGIPRVYEIADKLIYYTDGRVDENSIISFIEEYQTVASLTCEELWTIPFMIRIALIKKIKGIVLHIVESHEQKIEAKKWAAKLIEALDEPVDKLHEVIKRHDKETGMLKPAYTEKLLQILRDRGSEAASVIRWIDGRLALQGVDADGIIQLEHQQQASYQVSIGNSITTLRFLAGLKWEDIFVELSVVEKILEKDPAKAYSRMEFESTDYYRHAVEKIADKTGKSEVFIAQKAVECAQSVEGEQGVELRQRHVGYYLFGNGRAKLFRAMGIEKTSLGLADFVKKRATMLFLGSITIMTAILLSAVLIYVNLLADPSIWMDLLTLVISLVPCLSLATDITNYLTTHILPPCHLPKLEYKEGIPEESKTMIVIPTLITSKKRVRELVDQLEVTYLANQEPNLYFGIISDLKDAPSKETDHDNEIVETAEKCISELNARYGNGKKGEIFYLFHRDRKYNESQNRWMGWERKRGALLEFNRVLRTNKDEGFSTVVGDIECLQEVKYVITLDADTQLPRDTAKRLIGTIAHPMNNAGYNEAKTRVERGYGLIQPRIGIAVDSASRSFFALTFSGQAGVDPYTTAVSDVYQDLFCEGIFTGKGIYDVDAFDNLLADSIPENAILSHDLLEGSYVRAGLATDIEMIDGFPTNYISYAMRQHRWVRGDWQLLPWLKRRVHNRQGNKVENPLSTVSKWKIIDNLRRSLLSPVLLLLFLLGISILPGNEFFWVVFALVTLLFPIITNLFGSVLGSFLRGTEGGGLSEAFYGVKSLVMQIALTFLFLSYQAYLMADAIIRTIVRVCITHKNMLEWVTAADAEKKFKGKLIDYIRKMWPSYMINVIFIAWTLLFNISMWPLAASITLIWFFAPFIGYRISLPKKQKQFVLSKEQMQRLREIARRTWKYFDILVGSEDNYLPPDNFQEDPPVGVAHRTSPTNIGLYLMAIIAARDLGYIGIIDVVERINNTINTIERMDKWKGHVYNWYNTKNLIPLKPRCVSSVDSGNLVGYLVTVKNGLADLLNTPIANTNLLKGLKDTIRIQEKSDNISMSLLNMLLANDKLKLTEWLMLINDLSNNDAGRKIVSVYKKDIDRILPWVHQLTDIPDELKPEKSDIPDMIKEFWDKLNFEISPIYLYKNYNEILKSLSEILQYVNEKGKGHTSKHVKYWLKKLEITLARSHAAVKVLVKSCEDLINRIQRLIDGMDFRLLYDEKLELFSVGYDVEEDKLIKSYYDLLASEARQTSFIAIAKGDVPQKHWFKLGRALSTIGDLKMLLSWNGTMFEYLMPLLIMKSYDKTLLEETYTAAVNAQKQYGEVRHVPWGVSESAFYAFDLQLNYQYKAFGVPKLGLKRGLVNDTVVAPYSSIMALLVDPEASIKNLEIISKEESEGQYGFYDAIDYTEERMPQKKKCMVVKNYMVHHAGMSFIALDNYLNNNIMQTRFHNEPIVKATELLLQERIPKNKLFIKDYNEDIEEVEAQKVVIHDIKAKRNLATANTEIPESNILSNGSYSVLLTNSGAGFSKCEQTMINRWRPDGTQDDRGMFFYIQNLNSNEYWSATYNPSPVIPESYSVSFEPEKVSYIRKDGNIETKTEVVVSPENNAEIRKLTLVNHARHGRVLQVTSYFEPVLAKYEDEIAHPVFNNLFVQTRFIKEYNALIAYKRPRKKKDKTVYVMHCILSVGDTIGDVQYETSREAFIGRGYKVSNPRVMNPEYPLSNTVGAVLDPVMSLRNRISISSGDSAKVIYVTASASSYDEAVALAREYHDINVTERAFELAWTHSQVELRYLNMTSNQANLYQKILSHILYLSPSKRKYSDVIARNEKGQSGLWSYGISGDLPIVLIEIYKIEQIELVRQLLTAHEYWKHKGLSVDMVILNEYGNSYEQPVHDRINDLIAVSHARDTRNCPGGIYLIQGGSIDDSEKTLLKAAARIILSGEKGCLTEQLKPPKNSWKLPDILNLSPMPSKEEKVVPIDINNIKFFNDIGGFRDDGKEYVIRLKNNISTPLPWSNIIANKNFGSLITESGSSYSWYDNSRENKITPWSNDTVIDPSGEVIFLRDEKTAKVWTITPKPIREKSDYITRHGLGYSIFEHNSHGLMQTQTVFVSENDNVKITTIKLANNSNKVKDISLTYYAEWVLGITRYNSAQYIATGYEPEDKIVFANNRYNDLYQQYTAYIYSSIDDITFTGDRTEFIGRNRDLSRPAALSRINLSNRVGAGYDPCGAIQGRIVINPGEDKTIVFLIGQEKSLEDIKTVVNKYKDLQNTEKELYNVKQYWNTKCNTIKVTTPDESMDIMLNGWLLYQTLSCRLWGRSAFYQAGGAYGFRDQLQDVMSLVYIWPELTRSQIVNCTKHQFREGDVQHWWHKPYRGIRTRISDDKLFLPYVTADYIEITGDVSILDEHTHFLEDRSLEESENERYNIPNLSEERASVYEHCIRAIENSLSFGEHGLPLIGSGDWNDGMDRVGEKGRGESVWLAWFLYDTLKRFTNICATRKDKKRAERYRSLADTLRESIEANAWDGGWYRRAYFDDGKPLGSEQNNECKIDSISQSWSVISGAGKYSRIKEAMMAVENYLVSREDGLIKLLTPPFDSSDMDPGYIKGYLPGVRENGGQYTHAALWTILAFAKLGEGDKAWELYNMINPINHSRTKIEACRYKGEPYVTAADIYAVSPHTGRAGWTWYTGSASWMYRTGLEWILGFKQQSSTLRISPCIPKEWKEYSIEYKYMSTQYSIVVKNPNGVNRGIAKLLVDDIDQEAKTVPLIDDGNTHKVEILLGEN